MRKLTCIVCPKGCEISVEAIGNEYEVSGNLCKRGKEYAVNEMTNPKRSITSTVKTVYREMPRLPVRTDKDISITSIFPVMKVLCEVKLDHPVHCGEIIVKNVLGTDVNIIATSDMYDILEVM